ncbi:hypothetical protein [Polycyclovorans algicola]|uniref:hypothetical protein n=1 Tax=Polycyclovorans algicola TaxID=616992 RepID=UPI0004A75CDF|nr:hypothetical protein [Polycyclovorans algicola]
MPNNKCVLVGLMAGLTLAAASLAIAQAPDPTPPPTPAPSAPPPDREYRSSEEVSADTEVDFPADL